MNTPGKTRRILWIVALSLGCLGSARADDGFFALLTSDLGEGVNSSDVEWSPVLSEDGLTLYFASGREGVPGGSGGWDIYMATRADTDRRFGNVMNLGVPVNSVSDERPESISAGGLRLYFSSDRSGGQGGYDIYMATRADTGPFTEVMNLGDSINTAVTEFGAHVSPDELTLYFSSERLGGFGNSDLYQATRSALDAPFENVTNLGDGVNTPFDESYPVVSCHGLTLFFSDRARSPAPDTRGLMDLWVSTRANTAEPFGPRMNLDAFNFGFTINSDAMDGAPSINCDWPAIGSELYFVSCRFDSCDLYRATWVSCHASRTISPGAYFPGETVSVNLDLKTVPGEMLIVTETVPVGFDVSNIVGGTASADGITFDFDDSAQVTYELEVPADFTEFKAQSITGEITGSSDCSGELVVGDSRFPTVGPGMVLPWTSLDIGEPSFPGGARLESGDLLVAGGGGGILGGGDRFHFVYQEMVDDVILTARIGKLDLFPEDSLSSIGLMLRASSDAGAKHASLLLSQSGANQHMEFVRRKGLLTNTTESSVLEDSWVRIERSGNEFIGYHSANGIVWTELDRVTIDDMPEMILAGIAVTAGGDQYAFSKVTNIRFGPQEAPRFIRGDGNGDGRLNIADPSYIAGVIFGLSVAPITCEAAADANGDGGIDIADPSYVANFLFGIAPALPPPAPYPGCAPVPAEEPLACLGTSACLE